VIEGGGATLEAAREAVEANIPILVFAGSGKAADFIAAAYDRRERPLVLLTYYITITDIVVLFSSLQLQIQCIPVYNSKALNYIDRYKILLLILDLYSAISRAKTRI